MSQIKNKISMKRKAEQIKNGGKVTKSNKERDVSGGKSKSNSKCKGRKKLKNDKRKVDWDWKTLAEQEQHRIDNPIKTKIDEPKTPYVIYEGGDSEYLNKLNKVLKVKPSIKEVLDEASNKLLNRKISVDVMEVEEIDEEGHKNKTTVPKIEHQSPEEFLQKRKTNYHNEYIEAKKMINFKDDDEEEDEDKEEEALDNLTLKNTLLNKVVGSNSKSIKTEEDNDSK